MSSFWVHLSPVILDDTIFFRYIGNPMYTGTAAQRNASYLAAEQAMVRHLKKPLTPTIITGTWAWPGLSSNPTIVLPHAGIQAIHHVDILYGGGTGTCGLQETEGCYRIKEDSFGYIDVHCIGNLALLNCGCRLTDLYQVRIAYEAGLSTDIGTNDTSLHMALAMAAEMFLNEIVDPGASPGGPGAPGITSWSSLGYSEKLNEASLKMTEFGASARANRIIQLVRHLRKKRALRF